MIITPTFSTFKIPFYMGPLQLSGGGGERFEQSQPSLQTLSPLSKRGERRKIWRSRARKVSVFSLFYIDSYKTGCFFFFFVVFWLQQVLLFEPFGFTFLRFHTPEKTGGKEAFICVCVLSNL